MTDSLPSIDPATNSRFTDLGNGTYSEAMAAQVQLSYNVNTMAARANFNMLPYLNINGLYHQLGNDYDILEVDFGSKMGRCYGAGLLDPATQKPLDEVSVAGVMLLMKAATDIEHNERARARLAALAAEQQQAALTNANNLLLQAVASPAANGTTCDFNPTVSDLSVTFLDESVGGGGQAIQGWSWLFGDGKGYSETQDPTYLYETAGTYHVSLVVTDASGTNVTVTKDVTVTAPAPAPAPSP